MLYHLAYRNVINYSVYAAQIVITLILCTFVMAYLYKRVRMKEKKICVRILSAVGIVAVLIVVAIVSLNVFIRGVFGHQPEHVVERDGRMMLARVDSFLQVEVRYYNHINAIVRGNNILIHEDFGNGGYDPFALDEMPEVKRYMYFDENGEVIDSNWTDSYWPPLSSDSNASDDVQSEPVEVVDLDIGVTEIADNELAFTITLDEFISSFNRYYFQHHNKAYFEKASKWQKYSNGYELFLSSEVTGYSFTQDPQIWSLPRVSVYVPSGSDYIQQIVLTFDDHRYQASMYELYQEICFYTLKVFFPKMANDEITMIYEALYEQSGDNFFGNDYEKLPNSIYYIDDFALYAYYGAGTVNICILPLSGDIDIPLNSFY